MRKLLLFLIFGYSHSDLAQSVAWQRQFSVGISISYASGIVSYNDSTFYSLAAIRKWGYNVPNGATAMGIGFVRIKASNGDTIFVKRIEGWTTGSIKVLKSFEGSLVFASASYGDTIYHSKILVQKLDTNGNQIWVCPITSGYSNPMISKVLSSPDGGTFVLGSALSTIGGFQDFFLIKVSFNGELQWAKRYNAGPNWYCEANNIEPLRNGNFLISGMAERQVWAIEVNADGNQVNQQVIYETPQPYLIFGAQTAQGYHKSYYSFGVVQSNPRRFYFSKKDSLFQTIWGGEQSNLLGQFYASTNDGYSLLVSGKATTTDSIYLNFIGNDSLVSWRRALPRSGLFPTNALIYDVSFDGNGNVVLCGTSKKIASNRDELFFMKISGIGYPYDPFADTVLTHKKDKIRMVKINPYPNPTKDQVWFSGMKEAGQLLIFASYGRLLFDNKLEHGMPVSLATFPVGLYYYRLHYAGQWHSGKILKE